jgi:hypothetical protein
MFHFKPLNSIQLTHLPEAQQQVAETLNNEFANILDSVQSAPSSKTEASLPSAADRYGEIGVRVTIPGCVPRCPAWPWACAPALPRSDEEIGVRVTFS